jgi:hypothetical protein
MKTKAQELGITEFPYREYDESGKMIYNEYTSGYWTKRKYDSFGNEIYFEDSVRYWEKKEYDASGNIIYHETSEGVIEDRREQS